MSKQRPSSTGNDRAASVVARSGPSDPTDSVAPHVEGQLSLIVRRFFRHGPATVSLFVLLLLLVVAFAVPYVWPYDYADITPDASRPPSLVHPFGTDSVGHDAFAQVLRGTQRSVGIALVVALIATLIGSFVGLCAGYWGGRADLMLMRLVDLVMTLPSIALLGVVSANVGHGETGWFFISLVLAAVLWTPVARLVRSVCLGIRTLEFIQAARAVGASDLRIIVRHMLPNAIGPIIVSATLLVALSVLIESSLSFLGLGVKVPDTSLGLLVNSGAVAAQTRPWLFYFPGLFIAIIVMAVNLLGDGLRDAVDPAQAR